METRNLIGGEWSTPNNATVEVFNPSNLKEKVGVIKQSSEEDVFKAEKAAKNDKKEWDKKPGPQKHEIILNYKKEKKNNITKLKKKDVKKNKSSEEDVNKAKKAAKNAQKEWAKKPGPQKSEVLYNMAKALENNLQEVAELGSKEMGKHIGEMKGEVTRGIHLLRYYAGEGVRSNGSVIPASDVDVLQYSQKVPLGVVGLITPWNFPLYIPIWKMAPALICGNAVIWKPAGDASLTATRMVELFEEAGLPAGVLNLVVGKGSVVGK